MLLLFNYKATYLLQSNYTKDEFYAIGVFMSDLNTFLEQRRYFNYGLDQIAAGRTIYELLHGEVDLDQSEDSEPVAFEELDLEYSSALILGVATALEDMIRELPKRQQKKLKEKVFHTKKLPSEEDF